MYYIIQENTFNEEGHTKLIDCLEKFGLDYEIVKVRPFIEEIEFVTQRKDVFVFGAIKLSRLSKQYGWIPGSVITDNHDYNVYKDHYKENLLNYDSRVVRFEEDFEWEYEQQFIRPCLDSKTFTGKVFDKESWEKFRQYALTNGHSSQLDKDTLIQVAVPKKITQEIRFWIVEGKIVTCSTYRRGSFLVYDSVVDEDAKEFAREMVNIFQLAKTFVMDVCLAENGWKIVECGATNCAGFYEADMQKLIMALEDCYSK